MNRNFGACIVAVVLVFSIITSSGLSVVYAFSGAGSGTEVDPYVITTVAQLQEVNDDLDAWYVLGNDIDASETSGWNSGQGFDPIGDSTTPFTGHFDGQGYIISNLYINRPLETRTGLFGFAGVGADIQNVGLVDVDITGDSYVGGFVGWNEGTITSCFVTGSVSGSDIYVGGFVGINRYEATITCCFVTGSVSGNRKVGGFVGENDEDIFNCYFKGSVSGNSKVGGFVGENFYGLISDCYSMGSVSGVGSSPTWIGGFVGDNWYDPSIITNCYATGSVSGYSEVGGFAGDNEYIITSCYSTGSVIGYRFVGGFAGENSDTISNCYSTGSVSGDNHVGGFVGENNEVEISNCYSTGKVSGTSDVGGFAGSNLDTITSCYWDKDTSGMTTSDGGVGKTTDDMQQQATFTGWDFTSTWSIVEDVTYPDLRGKPEECLKYLRLYPVGGISNPINKLEILTPYLALAGLIIAVSAIVIKKRKD